MNQDELMEVIFYPGLEELDEKDKYTRVSLSELSDLGFMITQLYTTITANTPTQTDGIYKAIIPSGTHLAKLKEKAGYISTLIDENGIAGQAQLIPIDEFIGKGKSIDLTMICTMTMLMNLDQKLNEIQETQQNILSTIETQEHSQIKGNIKMLFDVISNLKYRYQDQVYKNDYKTKAIDIKQEAYQNIEKYKERISIQLNRRKGLHISSLETNKETIELVNQFQYYRLAIYMFSYSLYVETLLADNYETNVIENALMQIRQYNMEYRKLYTKTYNYLKQFAQSSLDLKAIQSLGKASKKLGKSIEKIPVISKTPVDDLLISLGNGVKSLPNDFIDRLMDKFRLYKDLNVLEFAQQFRKLEQIYNHENEFLMDHESIYIPNSELS